MGLYDPRSTVDLNRPTDACVVLLQRNRLVVTMAGSCTGGILSAKLVGIPGVPEVLQEDYITYSNKAKRRLLDANKATLKKRGAVSTQTVREMAIGAVFAVNADIAASITGITGPNGGDDEKPVGLVLIDCYMSDCITVEEYRFRGSRIVVRTRVVQSVLRLLCATILENTRA